METDNIKYPYLPEGRTILYVQADNRYISAAREIAEISSTDKKVATGAVIVDKEGKIVIGASNQTLIKNKFLFDTHPKWCLRKLFKIPTGQKYWMCPGCASSRNHAEARAVAKSKKFKINISGCDLYLWGHWWCCQPCWDKMINAGIKDVYLTKKE